MNPNDLPEVQCEFCDWTGDYMDLIDGCCPDCGNCDDIIDYEPDEDEE